MTLQQALQEVATIQKVVSENTKIQLTFEEIGSDEELIKFAEDNPEYSLHKPCSSVPYYWLCLWDVNIDINICGKRKNVTINY